MCTDFEDATFLKVQSRSWAGVRFELSMTDLGWERSFSRYKRSAVTAVEPSLIDWLEKAESLHTSFILTAPKQSLEKYQPLHSMR